MNIVLILLGLALIPAVIAKLKGRSFFGWYIYGICLWPIAAVHSVLVKPCEELQIIYGYAKRCPMCLELIKMDARICKYCGNDLSFMTKEELEKQKKEMKKALKEKTKRGVLTVTAMILLFLATFIWSALYVTIKLNA